MRGRVYRSAVAVGGSLAGIGLVVLAATAGVPAGADRICVDQTVHVTEPPPGVTVCVPIPSTSSTTLPSTTTTSVP